MSFSQDFKKFCFLDLTCGAGQLLYTAFTYPHMRDMKYIYGAANYPGQHGAALRVAKAIFTRRMEGTILEDSFLRKLYILPHKEEYEKLNPFTHIFANTLGRDGVWLRSLAVAVNDSQSVRFMMISLGHTDVCRYGFNDFVFRASLKCLITGQKERTTFFLYERRNCYCDKDIICRSKRDLSVSNAIKRSTSKTPWFG